MSRFQVVFELAPTRYFGISESNMPVGKVGVQVRARFSHAMQGMIPASSYTRPDGSETQRTFEERFRHSFMEDDWRFAFNDNLLLVDLDASDEQTAVEQALRYVETFMRLLRVKSQIAGPTIVPRVMASGTKDALRMSKPVWNGRYFAWDPEALALQMREAQALWRHKPDPLLELALGYFCLGDDLTELETPGRIGQLDSDISKIRFLQYWKVTAALLGDPSHKGDYQRRHRSFGLPANFYSEKILPLNRIRNDFNIAHVPRNLDVDSDVSREDVDGCRQVAAELITAFLTTR